MKPIPYGRQNITDDDLDAVINVLRSDFLTQGPEIAEFEKAFADYIGCRYAVAVSNGTAALHLSAIAMNVKPGDKVITTPITFAATANCIHYSGGEIEFADIDNKTFLLEICEVENILKKSSPGTYKGIIPVDFAGRAVDMQKFKKLAEEYNCWIIEDACHAPGGYFKDSDGNENKCGNGAWSDVAIFSFHPVKHITTGEGGMITTNNENLYKRLLMLRTHGITRDPSLMKQNHGGWYYEMQELGYNYRLTDFQAALGISQLKRADSGLTERKRIALDYYNAFKDKPYILGQSGVVEGHAYHLYVIQVERRKELYDFLRTRKIFCQVHYIPVHILPYYEKRGWKRGQLVNAEYFYDHCLSLPMFPDLSAEDQKYVISSIDEFFCS